jgi:Flp pilus assembly pilin Flp
VKRCLVRLWTDDRGVLSFEWVLLMTLVAIGVVGGLTAARDAVISELGDIAGAAVAIDQSYSLAPDPCLGTGGISFADTECNTASSCRPAQPPQIGGPAQP